MTFTYTPGATTDLNRVRMYSGDTVETAQFALSDEEINDILLIVSNLYIAAAMDCEYRAARFAIYADTTNTDGLSIKASQRFAQLEQMAAKLRITGDLQALSSGTIAVGGINIDENEALDTNTDNVQPKFRLGQYDNDGASDNDYEPDY